ncbi:DUF1150 domain-containing protein [Amorphus orientalis]|uniref:DUF1150 domain-containing protein n=1 Tax=Amorphus orientalis TaxID=649198 RepID=A0AAE3VLD7_9HYPH|nr:DUF1150 domain-containing protein [Amorphus orientalis]MDQ0314063.1 hypothetical protein [Amorphus orientalis]
MNRTFDTTDDTKAALSQEALAELGGGQVAYMKPLNGDEVRSLFPDAPQLSHDHKLWALLSADGTPIMLSDSREAVIANAQQNDLHMATVH